MINAILLSLLKVFLPVALTSYFLLGWLLYSGRMAPYADKKDFEAKLASLKKGHKENAKSKNKAQRETNYALNKWMSFGGGFYGTAALYSYAAIELAELVGFVIKMLNPANWTFDISISLIIGFFINSVMNFVAAILWFNYWHIGGGLFWINFITAYMGFALGARLANLHLATDIGHPQLWRWLEQQQENRAAETESQAD